jgi:hypothetical protein
VEWTGKSISDQKEREREQHVERLRQKCIRLYIIVYNPLKLLGEQEEGLPRARKYHTC